MLSLSQWLISQGRTGQGDQDIVIRTITIAMQLTGVCIFNISHPLSANYSTWATAGRIWARTAGSEVMTRALSISYLSFTLTLTGILNWQPVWTGLDWTGTFLSVEGWILSDIERVKPPQYWLVNGKVDDKTIILMQCKVGWGYFQVTTIGNVWLINPVNNSKMSRCETRRVRLSLLVDVCY